jgi:membrane protein DedA with SNARE-associated domain
MEHTSLSDALISLIPTYGPWIIFGIVSLESAGVPLPGETILVAAALLAATTGQISIVVVVLASAGGAIVGDGIGYMVGRRFGLLLIRRYGRMAAHGAKRSFANLPSSVEWRKADWSFDHCNAHCVDVCQ